MPTPKNPNLAQLNMRTPLAVRHGVVAYCQAHGSRLEHFATAAILEALADGTMEAATIPGLDKDNPLVQWTVRVPKAAKRDVKAICVARGVPMEAWLCEAVTRYLARHGS